MITYSLKIDGKNYDDYYYTLNKLSKMIFDKYEDSSKKYIDEFKEYSQKFEKIKDDKYYFIEIVLIGVLFDEYKNYISNFKTYLSPIYGFFNKTRNSRFKAQIDFIRGKINTSLYKENDKINSKTKISYNLVYFSRLIDWLDATYDFRDEVIRLKIWLEFLKTKEVEDNYTTYFFNFAVEVVDYLKELGDKYLIPYLPNLENYLKTYKEDHYNKEDIIYCGKNAVQYYFNMIFSEVMNEIFRKDFIKTHKKIVFLPGCMTQCAKPCKRSYTSYGGKCNYCSPHCNVNKISKLGEKYNFKVYIIEHETTLSSLNISKNKDIGIIGIACASNLISGGLKALRLGFVPQCVLLNFCGCSNHWLDKKLMTSINENRLLDIILNRLKPS